QRPEERRQRLARARRRGDERVLAGRDRRPGLGLHLGRAVERRREPVAHGGRELLEDHRSRLALVEACSCPKSRSTVLSVWAPREDDGVPAPRLTVAALCLAATLTLAAAGAAPAATPLRSVDTRA